MMKHRRSVLLFIFVSSLMLLSTSASAQQPCLQVKKLWMSENALRQGNRVRIELRMAADHCLLRETKGWRPHPKELSIATQDTEFRIDDLFVAYEKYEGTDKARRMTAGFSLQADQNLAEGNHEIPATVFYRAEDDKGNPVDGRLEVKIPIRVVAANAAVKHNLHDAMESKWNLVWEIPAVAAVSPLLIVLAILHVLPDC